MFVQNLNNEQQSILLSACKELMRCDGHIAEHEKLYLEEISKQCHKEVSSSDDFKVEQLSNTFTTQKEKTSFMLELIAMAFADKKYHENEQGMIKQICEIFDIDTDKLQKMEDWVKEQFTLVAQAKAFMGE